jgi:hypothetical protein
LPLTCFSAQPAKADPGPLIAPIHSVPAGQTYGRWAASWNEWALQIPAAENPVLDTTGHGRADGAARRYCQRGGFPGIAGVGVRHSAGAHN